MSWKSEEKNMCQHSELYMRENEQMGGVGCPICNAQQAPVYEPGCALGVCADCTFECEGIEDDEFNSVASLDADSAGYPGGF